MQASFALALMAALPRLYIASNYVSVNYYEVEARNDVYISVIELYVL